MKKLLGLLACTCLSTVLVFGTTGCPDKTKDKTVKTTEKKTTTETTTDKDKAKKVVEDKTVTETTKKWSVKAPADVTVMQGDLATVTVDITRDKFMDPVDVKFAGLPDGVTVPEKDWTIAKDATSTKFTLKAAADAKPVTDQKVTVTATSGTATQESSFKVTIKKKAKDEVKKEKDEVKKEKDEVKKEKDEVKKEKDAVKKEKDEVKKEKDAVKKEKDAPQKDARLSSDAIDFYALLNDRFLTPVYAVRSLQVSHHARRNEPFMTA